MSLASLLEGIGLRKTYGAVEALRHVDIAISDNETVALVGDNGAGKSTLVKILSGAILPTAGQLKFRDKQVAFTSTDIARGLGIETVYQDLGLCDNLTVAGNIFLGREMVRGFGPFVVLAKRAMRKRTTEALKDLSINLPPPHASVRGLSGGQRQAVALARARLWERSLILLDEPTAALGVQETKRAMDGVRRIRAEGASVLLVTHNMPMVMEMSDRVIVLRRGEKVGDVPTSILKSADDVVSLITGSREAWIEGSRPSGQAGGRA
jgi:ABC-type sugar transport system ATPase subunit